MNGKSNFSVVTSFLRSEPWNYFSTSDCPYCSGAICLRTFQNQTESLVVEFFAVKKSSDDRLRPA